MEYVDLARFVFSLIGVLSLIMLCAWIAKRFNVDKRLAAFKKDAQLSVLETCHIDPRHKLVLIKRNEKRHVLVLGQSHATLIESYDVPAAEVDTQGANHA